MSHCRSCDARIVWAITENRARMPLDHKLTTEGVRFRVDWDGVARPVAEGLGHLSHFATCEFAAKHRKRRWK